MWVVVENDRSGLLEKAVLFDSESEAAKYALYRQLQDIDFSDLDQAGLDQVEVEELKTLLKSLVSQNKYIEAYKEFYGFYWQISFENSVSYEQISPAPKEELDACILQELESI